MKPAAPTFDPGQVSALLRGEPGLLQDWIRHWSAGRMFLYGAYILLGAGTFGAAIGAWRGPEQAVYTALKFPLVILLTSLGNALLNGMLAPLLGLNLGFRQSLLVIFMSFTIAAAILGSFSPLLLFIVWNTPPPNLSAHSVSLGYDFMQLATVGFIAFAGVVANVRLVPLLQTLGGSRAIAYKVLLAWLAGNLFLGSQISWILRPFIGNPRTPIEFLSQHPWEGSFYESVFHALQHLLTQP